MTEYFLDTYALIEYLKGNKKFMEIMDNAQNQVTTLLNRMELYKFCLVEVGKEKADEYFETFKHLEVQLNESIVKKAVEKKLELNKEKKNVSYVDAIGYAIALENNLKFLTGDKAFKGLPNVEYIATF
jgi:predicted nucleic acid-binding protein